jgi:FkbM family methyltransferase
MSIRSIARRGLDAYHTYRIAQLGSAPSWRRVAGGLEMLIDPTDWVDQQFYLGTYEPPMQQLISALLRPAEIAVDVGTHKGFFTLQMAAAVGPGGMVIAADPDPRAFIDLQGNCTHNRLQNVHTYAVAIGDAHGTCDIAINRQLGWSSRFPNELARAGVIEKTTVRVMPLDAVIAECEPGLDQRVRFVKIDAEGSEHLVLAGMVATISEHRPAISVEVNATALAAAGSSAGELARFFREHAYAPHAIEWQRNRFGIARLQLREVNLASVDRPLLDVVAIPEGSELIERVQGFIASS